MRQLRAVLVDDEQLALTRLSRSLEAVDGVEVVASTTSAREAVRTIGGARPDLVFLDVAMPGLSGFDIVGQLRGEEAPAVIFVTAYDHYAVQAFGVDAVDYLLKPVAPARLKAAVGRARTWLDGRAVGVKTQAADSFWAHRHREVVRIMIRDVQWIEANGDYVHLHTAEGGGLVRLTLAALEAQLDGTLFMRVHRSAICRRSLIAGLRRKPTGALIAVLESGDEVPVGRRFGGGLRALLKKMQG
ncbi:MAG: response regulator transcription factor [Sphingomonas bacterium]|uniref:LytR/AlgR family response regulator transcription factor n=1 Tax=Sphingomonas bacterium TaxID=1895847 RepID=UPI002608B61D|nr:LytTR family DNA-binding domain-containing protein [Sphingomonas bacterium]MDB5707387.1 response regulator transcription factor [Sphingomonas bacterium]